MSIRLPWLLRYLRFSSSLPLLSSRLLPLVLLLGLNACATYPSFVASSDASVLESEKDDQCVVLVHGLWRSGFAMRSIASDLQSSGYQTVSVDYPSTQKEIPELAQEFLSKGYTACQEAGARQIHFVSHSMGGILVRQYLQDHRLPEGSKVVMLSPPNQGSELSEKFGDSWWYQWMVGPAGVSLNREGGIVTELNEIEEPVGIIAAYRDWSLWPDSWLPQPNDGTVSVDSMKLAEMDDFVMVNSGHAMMRYNDDVQLQIRQFLAEGSFVH